MNPTPPLTTTQKEYLYVFDHFLSTPFPANAWKRMGELVGEMTGRVGRTCERVPNTLLEDLV
jgi:hypothetical protein